MTNIRPHTPNYRISVPTEINLFEKIHQVPTKSLDKLHPEKTDPRPFAEYVEEGLWKSRVTYQKDSSPSVAMSKSHAQSSEETLLTLDAICANELRRRFPDFHLIEGFKAFLKNNFPILSKWILGDEEFYRELTSQEIDALKKQISFSACDRDDLICTPTIEDKELRTMLQLEDDAILETQHLFAKNSPMNGKAFDRDGKTIFLSEGLASTSDRTVENTGNLRVVQTKEQESICYAGRPDSDRRALEQASFIFFNELKTHKKGITETKDEQGHTTYQLDYVVNSLLDAPWIAYFESILTTFPERKFIEEERKALNDLKNKGEITLEDPNCPGAIYHVKFNPIFFTRSFDALTRVEKWLPPFLTGQSRSREISEEGFDSLKAIAHQKQNNKIAATLKILEHNLLPEEELLARDYLCKLLNLPIVYHCKSSLDRTSVPVAISSALKQWRELSLHEPVNICGILKDFRFKELFTCNWMAGHQMTRYACNRKGTVAGEKLKTKNLGFTVQRGLLQHPPIVNLLPDRYLKPFPAKEKKKIYALYAAALIPVTLLFYLPLAAITALRNWDFPLPTLPLNLIFNFKSVIPEKMLNEQSPQINERKIIAKRH